MNQEGVFLQKNYLCILGNANRTFAQLRNGMYIDNDSELLIECDKGRYGLYENKKVIVLGTVIVDR